MLTAVSLTSDAKMSSRVWDRFGPWLQAEREAASVSQADLAKASGLNVVHISRVENGKSGIKRETLITVVNEINRLSSGHVVDLGEALKRAGFAPDHAGTPETLEEFVRAGNALGVEDLKFDDPEAVADATPDEYREVLRAMQLAYDLTRERQKARREHPPPNAAKDDPRPN
jgi:transcriptional regulator with XRE-family HTH domain